MTAAEAYNALSHEDRLKLLAELEFENPSRYLERDERNTRFECMFYEVQCELAQCYTRGVWAATPAELRQRVKTQQVLGAKGETARSSVAPRAAKPESSKLPVQLDPKRQEIANAIKDFKISITMG
jgi:hypothetical protein